MTQQQAEDETLHPAGLPVHGWERLASHAGCAVGAALAVMLIGGTLGSGGEWFRALEHVVGVSLAVICVSIVTLVTAGIYFAVSVLRSLPWTAIFYATGTVCAFFACRRVKTRLGRAAVWYSLLALAIEWFLRLVTMPADADVLRFNANAMVVATLILIADGVAEYRFERLTKAPRAGLARHADSANIAVVALLAMCASAILSLFWDSVSTDSYPHASSVVMSRYGAELERMGFQDAGLYTGSSLDVPDSDSVAYDFADGSQDFPRVIIEWGAAADPQQPQTAPSLMMRMREGKLTIKSPPRATGMTPKQAEEAEIKAADVTMAEIRSAYGQVQRNRAAGQPVQN